MNAPEAAAASITSAPNSKAAAEERPVWGDLYPAFPGDIVVKQPDGETFKAKLTNAEVGGNP